MFSLYLYVLNNMDFFMTNFENHNTRTRQIKNLHLLPVDLTTYQQEV